MVATEVGNAWSPYLHYDHPNFSMVLTQLRTVIIADGGDELAGASAALQLHAQHSNSTRYASRTVIGWRASR